MGHGQHGIPDDVKSAASQPSRTTDWGRNFFALSRGGTFKTNRLDPMINALIGSIASLYSPASFLGLFGNVADLMERIRSLDSSEPLDLFQRCYTALELLAEREQVIARRSLWPEWLGAWRTFLEFSRACAAC